MSKKVEDGTSRRDFLKLAATGAPAVAVVTAATGGQAEAAEPDLASTRCKIPRTRALTSIAPGSDRTISPDPLTTGCDWPDCSADNLSTQQAHFG